MNPLAWSFRAQFASGFLICTGLIAFAIFTQFQYGLEPCPLCIFQRIAYFILGLLFLMGALHAPNGKPGRRRYGLLGMLAAGVGFGIAARHVWIQLRPPQHDFGSCAPPLSFLSEQMGPFEVFRTVLTGTADCSEVTWRLFGLSMPMWSLICFVVLAAWALYAGFKRRGPRRLF